MENKKIFGEGQPIENEKDIVGFLKFMSKKYNIKKEKGVVKALVNNYKESPKGKDHIVMSNRGDEWYTHFLSNEEVCHKIEIHKDTKVF